MAREYVACSYCMDTSFVEAYDSVCPKCNEDGFLMYADEAPWLQEAWTFRSVD